MTENIIMSFVMGLIMIAPYWLITALAIYMFEDGHKDKAGKHVVSGIWSNYIIYNLIASVLLVLTGRFSKGFFAGLPEMRVVIIASISGYVMYSHILRREYKRVCAKFQKRDEAKARIANI